MSNVWLRVNGIGHAFSRELGCDCGRCRTINFSMSAPPGRLSSFPGWDDPPWRAHTSVSILVSDDNNTEVESHILIDVGAGVVDSLVCSGIKGLENVKALFLTHWHPDHVLSLNQFCESSKRTAKSKGVPFVKIPVYCTQDTYDSLRGGYSYEFGSFLIYNQLTSAPVSVLSTPSIKVTALSVVHGSTLGAVIYVAEIETKKVIFGWDIDIPNAAFSSGQKNIDVISANLSLLKGADILFVAANTRSATGTGHTSYELARDYIRTIKPKKVYLIHLSGHEDDVSKPGYGWSDSEWELKTKPEGVMVAKQGMVIPL